MLTHEELLLFGEKLRRRRRYKFEVLLNSGTWRKECVIVHPY